MIRRDFPIILHNGSPAMYECGGYDGVEGNARIIAGWDGKPKIPIAIYYDDISHKNGNHALFYINRKDLILTYRINYEEDFNYGNVYIIESIDYEKMICKAAERYDFNILNWDSPIYHASIDCIIKAKIYNCMRPVYYRNG